jgi:hypothetical protein
MKETTRYEVVLQVGVTVDLPRDSSSDNVVSEAIRRAVTTSGRIRGSEIIAAFPVITP